MLKIVILLILGLIIICYKLNSARIKLQQQVKHLSPMIQTVENSKDILYYLEIKPRLKYQYLSPVIENFLGINSLEEHLKNPDYYYEIVHPDDYNMAVEKLSGKTDFSKPIITRMRNDEGKYLWFEEYATPIYENGEFIAIHGVHRNIDDRILLQQQLEYKVTHDALTDIYNREHFENQLQRYNEKIDVSIAIIICDLDELKMINDHYGHKVGDNLIQESAKLLMQCANEEVKDEDEVEVARIGGDEFAITLINTDPLQVETFLVKVQNRIDHFNEETDTFNIKMSKGHAYHFSSIGKMEQLFVEADSKMYKEKNNKVTSR
ncbi:diguanylate cyclase [Psychrobacillus glaciei]|uniref:Diguanylate cyclase n=1 Tax=Psychrobacillus glaciei TaxID=2283160 RepID=A0A5J6SIZ4_9BACI|nr:diguanylate cyclase [Psychrobacillus glaciei]QFF97579.1 diguanylate cyclase [Psychrobacillus glaciei]